jgi:hypothetical protein
MSDQADDDRRRDKLLLRLMKAPPHPRPKRDRQPAAEQKEGQEENKKSDRP